MERIIFRLHWVSEWPCLSPVWLERVFWLVRLYSVIAGVIDLKPRYAENRTEGKQVKEATEVFIEKAD
jgi:hypothetical protein